MVSNKLYSNVILRGVRAIASITFLLLIFTTSRMILHYYNTIYGKGMHIIHTIAFVSSFTTNITTIIFAAILIFYPHKFFFIGIGSILQSLVVASFTPNSYMSLLMLGIATGTFLVRTNHIISRKRFYIFIAIIYLYELFFPLIYDNITFVNLFVDKFGGTFALLICLFFFYQFAKQNGVWESSKEKILNLAQYPGLERSDMLLLQDILNKMKYKEIAQKIHGSEGALRNKLSKIYKILEVGDRTGFLTIYSGYELIYDPEAVETSQTN